MRKNHSNLQGNFGIVGEHENEVKYFKCKSELFPKHNTSQEETDQMINNSKASTKEHGSEGQDYQVKVESQFLLPLRMWAGCFISLKGVIITLQYER
jgi:hypothetical protein